MPIADAQRFSDQPMTSRRVALCVEYDGSAFFGWQSQANPELPTVQGALEQALSKVANQAVRVHCAGRTDSRVHASYQIVHFEVPVQRSAKAWVFGANANLPAQVAVQWAVPVADDFHARFTATARSYRYVIHNVPVRSALVAGRQTLVPNRLDETLMHEAAQALLGEKDFSAFRGAACQSNSPFRYVEAVAVRRYGDRVLVEITANAFVLHMVRNIAGSLIEIGQGRQALTWMAELLAGRDRSKAAATAPPDGLYLVDVRYPPEYGIPAAKPFELPIT